MKKRLKKLIDTAQDAPHTILLAGDEASGYLQATLQVVWHCRGETPMLRLGPGRKCTHFFGALNLMTGHATAIRTQLMNADTSALYLLLAAYPTQPILLLWDRAPWHRGKAIQRVLDANPRPQILRFPTAAPDLNPQEQGEQQAPVATEAPAPVATDEMAPPLTEDDMVQGMLA